MGLYSYRGKIYPLRNEIAMRNIRFALIKRALRLIKTTCGIRRQFAQLFTGNGYGELILYGIGGGQFNIK